MTSYVLTVPMKVVGKARPRVVRNYERVHVFTPDTTAFEPSAEWYVRYWLRLLSERHIKSIQGGAE